MRCSTLITALLTLGSAQAFSTPPSFVAVTRTHLAMTSETHMDKGYTVGSGMTEDAIPVLIKNLAPDNFEESLEMLEPLLTNECVGDEHCGMFMEDLKTKCQEIGMELPEGFAPTHH